MMKEQLIDLTVRHYIKKLRKDPEKQIPKVLKQIDMFAGGRMAPQMNRVHMMLDNPDSNIFKMVVRGLNEVDPVFFTGLGNSFVINTGFDGWAKQTELREKYQCNIPWAILLDPTSACNLHCTGCWAADYGNRLNLSYEDIDSIIKQGTELGIYFYIYTGGEPLIRKKDIIKLCEAHPECVFLCFTNGTLIDQEFCDDLKRVANFVPGISLEGNREATDSRRGEGTYDKVIGAMKLMHENMIPFGVSCCYTSENYESVTSDEYVDMLVELGAFFLWFFHYMPVGSDANVELMVTPEQREGMYHTVRRWREEKPIFPLDFQNDGQYVQGCIAGGRRYLHINAAGDVDPCVFIHFSDSNIHEKTLLECLQGPLFKAYYDNQPFNDNHLRPCPMLENPDALRRMIKETGAKSSNLEGEETAEMLCDRCEKYAKEWAPTAEKLWEINHNCIPFKH
ncbi:MAG: radical SAM protein [Coriobacteriales bacterium]|jgi:MoaA/NifB/PqqE/SkfB family radical SAM enzyme